jgi:anaerobic nitric oxide reductase flavorubredoxin
MRKVEVADGVYWVGAVDWNIRNFHGFTYSTQMGTTYNAYLIMDEKIALVDTVLKDFAGEMFEKIKAIVDPQKIDYMIANHVETDHSGSIPEVMKIVPQAKVYCTAKGTEGLSKHYFENWDFTTLKTGDELNLGEKTLKFIEAPMLHWPDSMFTLIEKDKLLLPNDAFGQHLASSERFDDEADEKVLMDQAAEYYANILWPFSSLVIKKIEELVKLGVEIKTIAPSHGIIWRKHPDKIIQSYLKWAKGEADKRILIVYDTMWGSTEKMAKKILEGTLSEGIQGRICRLPVSNQTEIIKDLLEAKGILIGSPTINRDILPTVAPFLEEIKGLRPVKKIGAAFGSYGWAGGAMKTIEEYLKRAGIEMVLPPLEVKYHPDEDEMNKCFGFGKEFARKIQVSG